LYFVQSNLGVYGSIRDSVLPWSRQPVFVRRATLDYHLPDDGLSLVPRVALFAEARFP